MVELFRDYRILQPSTTFSPLDQTTPPGACLETMEESPNPCAGTPETGYFPQLCSNNRVCPKRPLADEQGQMGSYRLAGCLLYITWAFVPLDLILPDQPNRRIRTRTYGGVGGGSCEAPPYPDRRNPLLNYSSLNPMPF